MRKKGNDTVGTVEVDVYTVLLERQIEVYILFLVKDIIRVFVMLSIQEKIVVDHEIVWIVVAEESIDFILFGLQLGRNQVTDRQSILIAIRNYIQDLLRIK